MSRVCPTFSRNPGSAIRAVGEQHGCCLEQQCESDPSFPLNMLIPLRLKYLHAHWLLAGWKIAAATFQLRSLTLVGNFFSLPNLSSSPRSAPGSELRIPHPLKLRGTTHPGPELQHCSDEPWTALGRGATGQRATDAFYRSSVPREPVGASFSA
jgi:hypothetical protein